ncbi:peptide chain release factor N(5)-glutamine methyltransferase [Alkalibacillus aidingensis]|uniref:peptide chain release factor N(5)-glutamine methyltransferase n=1 Tax=Alkalibacillus aidingensis TaxID=2747607 RepID=UPI001CB7073C|nr:peptide chain release factor N(5)-glutamine methyltransferase [Alkalibacillus aidingensis]
MEDMTVRGARIWASSFLKEYQREERVAELMLMHILGVSRSEFLAMQRDELPRDQYDTFVEWVSEHAKTGKPLEHFTGVTEFYSRDFLVNEHVLIPRPETEELIEALLQKLDNPETFVDLGTGSGIIAVTLKQAWPEASVYATDISEEALAVAKKNSTELEADVQFFQGDFLKPILEKGLEPDVVVSNPPYIPYSKRDQLSSTVMHDPEQALFADDDGLAAYQQITEQVLQLPTRPELVAFEIGHDQGETVPRLIHQQDPNASIQVIKDINGKNRIVLWE